MIAGGNGSANCAHRRSSSTTDDPVLPYGHGLALAKEIPGAHLLPLEQTGHGLPRAVWDAVVPVILCHTSPG
jgi:pimeloyl-ACP methyl ester carboxylesterase